MEDRRQRKKTQGRRYHPAYRVMRRSVVGALWLAAALVFGVLLVGLYNPALSGPAYLALISANLLLIGVLVIFSMRKLLVMFLDRRGKLKGGRLHVRLLGIFTVLAMGPAIGVTLLAVWLMNQGIESWFNAKVNNALEGSLLVAEAYVDEHERTVRAEVEALSRDGFWRGKSWFLDADDVRVWVRQQLDKRRLDELTLTDDNGDVLAASGGLGSPTPPDLAAMMRLGVDRAVSYRNLENGRIVVAAPVTAGGNSWWLIGQRSIAPAVLARVDQTNAAYAEYAGLRLERQKIRLIATLTLIGLAVTALAGAIWTGIQLANRIVRPVTALVHATNRVSAEDFEIRLVPDQDDELGVLTQSFNRMILQLKNSRALLEKKNKELDNRRRSMEAVLTGVTAGVLSVDPNGLVGWCNQHAEDMLAVKAGTKLGKSTPDVAQLVERVVANPPNLAKPLVQEQVKVAKGDETMTLQVRMVPQFVEGGRVGSVVVTCDDITPLMGAQRVAAWRDVARRLAHEIKNPLTPIQLSAERLRRKYLKSIPQEDQELFAQLTDTIVRQSEEMRRMTNEFSDFARMPEPVMQEENVVEMLEEIIALQRTARSDVSMTLENKLGKGEQRLVCDRGQVTRVLVNLLENASNAIAEREGTDVPPGEVKVVVKKTQDGMLGVTVLDNGRGLPPDVEVETLFDPYVTTRKGGTGLGLAIVRKVIDEHKGSIRLARRKGGGTQVDLSLPFAPTA